MNDDSMSKELRHFFGAYFVTRTLGADYYPLPEFTYTEWVRQVVARLRKHANEIDGPTASSNE